MRQFPPRVQNRVIRAGENLRHFVLTGRLLDNRLRMGRMIALRLASGEEFVLLSKKAEEEKHSNDAIKRQIRNRREDHHRT